MLARPDRAAHAHARAAFLSLAAEPPGLTADYNPHSDMDRIDYVPTITNTAIVGAVTVTVTEARAAPAARTTTGLTFLLIADATNLIPR